MLRFYNVLLWSRRQLLFSSLDYWVGRWIAVPWCTFYDYVQRANHQIIVQQYENEISCIACPLSHQ